MDVPQGRGMTTPEEVKSLRDTIATLRQRIAAMGRVERCGTARRLSETRGAHPALWRVKP